MSRVWIALCALACGVACDSPTVEVLVPQTDPEVEGSEDSSDDGEVDDASDSDDDDDDDEPFIYTDCESVLTSAVEYDRCDDDKLPEEGCTREDDCRLTVFYCEGGILFEYPMDKCDCQDDTDCGPGYLCVGQQTCRPCPNEECGPCPEGLYPLTRNGCSTCECALPSQCYEDLGCGEGYQCALGQACASECSRLDCCVNACTDGSCVEAPPEGCSMDCDRPECGNLCLAESCWCDAQTGRWECKEGPCDLVGSSCFYTP